MKNKYHFLDPAEQHNLTQQECELIAFFRAFPEAKRHLLLELLFSVALRDKRLAKMTARRKVLGDSK